MSGEIEITIKIRPGALDELEPGFADARGAYDSDDPALARLAPVIDAVDAGRSTKNGRVVTLRGRAMIEAMADEAEYRAGWLHDLAEEVDGREALGYRTTARGLANLASKCRAALDGSTPEPAPVEEPTVEAPVVEAPIPTAVAIPRSEWEVATTLPDGRHLELDDEFTITGGGRFRLKAIRPNGEVTAWGPIASNGTIPHGGMRTFRPTDVATVHRKKRAQDALREEEN